MIIERNTWRDNIDKSRTLMHDGALNQRHQLFLVPGETPRNVGRTELHGQAHQIDRFIGVYRTAFTL